MKELLIGLLASAFFAVTFILNRSMELDGGSWMWSSSLRFFSMIPFLLILVLFRRKLMLLLHEMRKQPIQWLIWSFLDLFYFMYLLRLQPHMDQAGCSLEPGS